MYRSDCVSACLRPFHSHGKSCCAVGCTNRYKKGTNQSFYRFPVEPNRRARWTAAVNRKNWIGVTGTRGFAAHTSSPEQKGTILLSPSYVPTVFSYVESLVKRKGAQNLARYERGTATKRKEDKSFRQLQETAMAHEEQRDCSLAEDASLEVRNSPLDPENKCGTAEVVGGTVDVAIMTDIR